ncbi:hypothetical protein ACFQHW_09610 [Lapidilactobacillus achengensis]|uniref:Uncharacterized protein n=1 Tax=Lapidilactobacillus achengensis TaxID=2486000 RepID=A0ABW1URI2_9LACO|nr:hypothetical protein [Lapidilactobacillus achengensis]
MEANRFRPIPTQKLAEVHQPNCPGVTNLKLATTNHDRQLRGSPSLDDSLPVGVSAQTPVKTLSGWSGEIRGEIAVKLVLVALPLRPRPDFETSRALCGLAQNSAHSELTPNFAAQAAANLLLTTKCSVPHNRSNTFS